MQKKKYNILNIVKLCIIPMLFIFPVSGYYLNGTILNNSDSTGLNNTIISDGINTTYSNTTGFYSLNNVSGSKNYTFSNNPKFYQNITNITITGNTIRDVNLSLKPTGTITGCVSVFQSVGCFREAAILYSNRIMWFI